MAKQKAKDFDLTNPPPQGDDAVGAFAYDLFVAARDEKDRLGLPDRWFENHRLYRGDHWNKSSRHSADDKHKIAVNLIFANIQRTVANLTSREPVAEVHSTDGIEDDADQLMSQKVKNWWNESEQGLSLARSALNMEIYGTTIEKFVPNIEQNRLDTVIVDPYSWFPCPGYYEDLQDMPYLCQAYPMPIADVEAKWGVSGVIPDDTYSLLGEDREENIPIPKGTRYGSGNANSNYAAVNHPRVASRSYQDSRALVVEVWLRDHTTTQVETEVIVSNRSGALMMDKTEQLKYPGGIRKITFTNNGELVLDDSGNPNINPAIPFEQAKNTYGWDNFPFAKGVSYEDSFSIWGFSAAEQVGDLQYKINEILSRIASYINLVTMPPLILPKDTGIDKVRINNKGGLVIRPQSTAMSQGIRYLAVPNLPSNFFDVMHEYMGFFDRLYAIQDVDRGQTPSNIQAASAIVTLQERNAVLLRHKIRQTDYLVRERGRWAISFNQNFGWKNESITVNDTPTVFRGTDYAGRQFNFVVESGSTVAKTSLQVQEDAKELYKMGVIDREALLDAVNFPNWKAVIERAGEGQLDQALQILIQAGLPQDQAVMLKQMLMQSQGGPGNMPQNGTDQPQPGMPRAEQGQLPAQQVQPTAGAM